MSNNEKPIAVFGATEWQGGGVVRALNARGQFKVRALSRNPEKHRELADEVVEANLDRPATLTAAFRGAHGVFLVTNVWEEGTDEVKQATAAVRAAKNAGVKHFIWSTLPNTEVFAGGFPGGAEVAATFRYFEAHTYLGSDSFDRIALANKVAGGQPSTLSTWARANVPAQGIRS